MAEGIRTNVNGASRSYSNTHNYSSNNNSSYRSNTNQSQTITLDLRPTTNYNASSIVTNVNASTNRVSTYTKKSYEELSKMYDTDAFTADQFSDMWKKGYLDYDTFKNIILNGHMTHDASYDVVYQSLENKNIDSHQFRELYMEIKKKYEPDLYNSNYQKYSDERTLYTNIASSSDLDKQTMNETGRYIDFSKKETSSDGSVNYYDKNDNLIKVVKPNGSLYFPNKGIYYTPIDENSYKLVHDNYATIDSSTINPKTIKRTYTDICYSDGSIERSFEKDGVKINKYLFASDQDKDTWNCSFYYEMQSNGETVSESSTMSINNYMYDYSKKYDESKYNLIKDNFVNYEPYSGERKITAQDYKKDYENSYDMIKKVSDTSTDEKGLLGGKTMWFDGQMHSYSSKTKLDDGSIQYNFSENIGTKIVKPDGSVIASFNSDRGDGYTSNGLHMYKANNDGTYDIADGNRYSRYSADGVDLYRVNKFDMHDACNNPINPDIEYSTHVDYK